ncbi:hypothetical protein CCHL11_04163 [Colletotrichum chlorophyti]|uniref:Antigenic cell wall galactomannoprotein n=1 Tax=Colletotrichum chlorophyti TaxID=708187 RepID=A0A1Q8RPM3_9PEZI|nr:hypothetical protein CCHL11_04163 [Colletotrichum chlorophyti]
MRVFVLLSVILCLVGIVNAQVALPIEEARGRGSKGKDNDNCRRGCRGKGGKGDKGSGMGGSAALQSRITDLQMKLAATNDTVVPFKGGTLKGLTGLLKVNEAVVTLGKSIDSGTKTAEATKVLPANESTVIGTRFLGIQPDINNLLTNLGKKRKEFDKAGFNILDVRSLIRDTIVIQKDKAGDLGDAFIKILDPSLQPIAEQVNSQIQANFSAAVDKYKGRGGKIKIPSKAVPKLSELLAGLARALGIGNNGRIVAGPLGSVPETAAIPEPNAIAEADAISVAEFPNIEAAYADLNAADTPQANMAAEAALRAISDDDLSRLGPDENDLRGVPLPVLAVLRRFGVI